MCCPDSRMHFSNSSVSVILEVMWSLRSWAVPVNPLTSAVHIYVNDWFNFCNVDAADLS